jgi:multiple sugar transport system permease protein
MAQIAQTERQRQARVETTTGGPAQKINWRKYTPAVVRHIVLILVSILFIFPFYWMLITSLKENTQVFTYPIEWWPDPIRWENYSEAINYSGFPFFRYLRNSVFFAGGVTIGTVLSCAAVGYGFARLRFPGRDFLFVVTVATLMIPGIVTFIPTFILFRTLGMLGTYVPLVLPAFFGNPFFIFMMRQFFQGLPLELVDAARVDGAGEFRIFWQIMLPLVQPALLVMAVFTFLWTWHDFFGPLVYLSDQNQYPLSLGLFAFRAQRTTEWSLMMAASTLATLPLIIVFFFAQRYFLEGIKLTGIKG